MGDLALAGMLMLGCEIERCQDEREVGGVAILDLRLTMYAWALPSSCALEMLLVVVAGPYDIVSRYRGCRRQGRDVCVNKGS